MKRPLCAVALVLPLLGAAPKPEARPSFPVLCETKPEEAFSADSVPVLRDPVAVPRLADPKPATGLLTPYIPSAGLSREIPASSILAEPFLLDAPAPFPDADTVPAPFVMPASRLLGLGSGVNPRCDDTLIRVLAAEKAAREKEAARWAPFQVEKAAPPVESEALTFFFGWNR